MWTKISIFMSLKYKMNMLPLLQRAHLELRHLAEFDPWREREIEIQEMRQSEQTSSAIVCTIWNY